MSTAEPNPFESSYDEVPQTMLTDYVSLDTLQSLQDRFSELGQVTVCITSVHGDMITAPTWGSRFSQLVAESPLGGKAIEDSVRALVQDRGSTVTSMCHPGMALYATPIELNTRLLAYMVVGTRPAEPLTRELARQLADQFDLDFVALAETTAEVIPWNGEARRATYRLADLLASTVATMYAQAERIQRQLADLRAVHELTESLSGTRDLQEILDRTVRRVTEVMGVKACAIRLLNESEDELVIKAVHNLSDEYLQKGPVKLSENEIDREVVGGRTVFIEDARDDPRIRYPLEARREGIVSGLSVPMSYRGRTVGMLRVYTDRPYVFDDAEKSLLRSVASQSASAIITSQFYEAQAESDRFHRQLQYAGEIQRRMLPDKPPEWPALSFGCVYRSTVEVGGDFYDFIELPDGRLGLCVADVVGKGMPAALMMASIRAALRSFAQSSSDPREIIAGVNRHMCRETLISEFATVFCGAWSSQPPSAPSLTYCNAGHVAPLLLRRNVFTTLEEGGLVIGVSPSADYEKATVQIEPGDIIAFVTDGVTEAMNFDGEAYGETRLRESILRHRELDAQHLADQLLWDVRRFVGLADQSDDITIVAAKADSS